MGPEPPMKGERVLVDDELGTVGMKPGQYGYWRAAGHWVARTPNGEHANLAAHEITDHGDGTITVSPSIGVRKPGLVDFLYHGWLERGVWRDA